MTGSASELDVYMDTRFAGVLRFRDGRATFRYDPDYDLVPVSLSMPHWRGLEHKDQVVKPYLQGLLPDDAETLDAWRRQFKVRSQHPFVLLREVGEECAGAVRFVRPGVDPNAAGDVVVQTEPDIERLIQQLRVGPAPVSHPGVAAGQFSLAGAQTKFSLLRLSTGEWAMASGVYPSTHIVKPALERARDDFTGKELCEHVCVTLARACDLLAPLSSFVRFGAETAIVVQRYDRRPAGDPSRPDLHARVHQEDLCQALGVEPDRKYDPTIQQIAGLIGTLSPADRESVAAAFGMGLMYNWLIAGTDAHAKNYSLLHALRPGAPAPELVTRLAPLYDVISYLPFRSSTPRLNRRPGEGDRSRVKLPMTINSQVFANEVDRQDWMKVEAVLGLSEGFLVEFGRDLSDRLVARVPVVVAEVRATVGGHEILDRLEEQLPEYVRQCRHALTGGRPAGRGRR